MAALNLSVMPWSPRTNQLMFNAVMATETVKNMHPVSLFEIRKFAAIVGLNNLWRVSEKSNRTLYKIDRGIPALLFIRVNKSFS